MRVENANNLSFKNLYVIKGLDGLQNSVAFNVSNKLSKASKNGVSYLQEIKNKGYDVLIIKTELNDPEMVRLCVIKNMESMKQPDGEYDFIDALPICETGRHFSAEKFLDDFEIKTAPKFPKIKAFFSKLFDN